MHHAQPRLTDITFVAFDTETTGLQPIVHRLVEVGAVRFRLDGLRLATFQTAHQSAHTHSPGRPAGARHH